MKASAYRTACAAHAAEKARTRVTFALRCVIEVQRSMAEGNAEVPDDKRVEFRIGIDVGDVMAAGEGRSE